jgi:hypothetical protein
MGVTPSYALPYPEATDPADVPTDMRELAERVEAVIPVKGTAVGQIAVWDGSKWVARAGPVFASVEPNEQITTGSYGDLATPGPSVTLPEAGDYIISWGCLLSGVPGNAWGSGVAVKFGAAVAVDADAINASGIASPGAAQGWTLARRRRYNALAAGLILKLQYSFVNYGMFAAKRWLMAERIA